MSEPLRLLVITSQLPPDIGGTSVHAAEIARGLGRLGHEVTVVIRDRDPAEFAGLELDVRSVDTKRGWFKPLRIRRAQADVLALIEETRAQAVFFAYTVVGFGDLYGRLASLGIPYAVGIHGFNQSDLADEKALAYRRKKWGLEGAARVIVCTRWLGQVLSPLVEPAIGRPADVVNYGIDPRIDQLATPDKVAEVRRLYGLEGRRVLLCLGRYVPRKNFDQIIRLLPRLAARFDDLCLFMVGGGQEEANLRALAAELGVADRVVWGPQVSPLEVGTYYKAADLFVTVSKTREGDDTYETFGLVYAEANLCGTAVVGGKEGGVPEAVTDGETGLLASSEDEEGIHTALERLLGDDELRHKMAARGRARVLEHFTWDRAARETAVILGEIAKK
ncbi:MAG: glycosyltransferase family 4 protein [Planctomycetota bacterium]